MQLALLCWIQYPYEIRLALLILGYHMFARNELRGQWLAYAETSDEVKFIMTGISAV